MNQVDRQTQTDDGVQGGGCDQITAMQYGLRTQRFGFGDSSSKRFTMIVAVRDYADFQISPP